MKKFLISVLSCIALSPCLSAADTLNVALALPFRAGSTPSNQAFAFYSGALLAIREAAEDSLAVNAEVIDVEQQGVSFTGEQMLSYDIFLGPFKPGEVSLLADLMPEGKFLISPIDPACISLVDSLRIIHTPTMVPWQYNQLAKWAGEDFGPADAVAVVHEASSSGSALEIVTEKLQEDQIPYTLFSVNSFEDIGSMLSEISSAEGVTRIILLAENEDFAKRILEVAGTLSDAGGVSTYALAKVRTFDSITDEVKAAAGLKILAEYFTDAGDAATEDFSRLCNKFYKCSPSQFTYHGYDVMRFFIRMFLNYGKDWACHFEGDRDKGLQTDFRFVRYGTGFVNTALRRIGYSKHGQILSMD